LLDSFQIAAALKARGFKRTATKTARTKAHGFETAGMRHPLYVRMDGTEGNILPAKGHSLALHPADAARIRQAAAAIAGIHLKSETRASTAYVGFPTRLATPRSKGTPEGVQCAVDNESALDALLTLLLDGGLPTLEPATSVAAARAPMPATEESDENLEPAVPVSFEARVAADEVNQDPQCQDISETTRQALINARMGQGGFRRRMLKVWGEQCAVTGCAEPIALVASHAKPWSEGSNAERLDEYNGLLLTASIDRLFDKGLISFTDDGSLLRKASLVGADLVALGLTPGARLSQVLPRHLPYLAFHRAKHNFND